MSSDSNLPQNDDERLVYLAAFGDAFGVGAEDRLGFATKAVRDFREMHPNGLPPPAGMVDGKALCGQVDAREAHDEGIRREAYERAAKECDDARAMLGFDKFTLRSCAERIRSLK